MTFMTVLWIVLGAQAQPDLPRWIALLPPDIDRKLEEVRQAAMDKADQACAAERAAAWAAMEKSDALAESGAPNESYQTAADAAEEARGQEESCRRKNGSTHDLEFKLPAHQDANAKSKRLGTLIIQVQPWTYDRDRDEDADDGDDHQSRLVFWYEDSEGKRAAFTPDVPHPYAEKVNAYHTVTGQKGRWFRLPKRPFPEPVWIDFSTHHGEAPLTILKTPRPVFVNASPDGTGRYVLFTRRTGAQLEGLVTTEDRDEALRGRKPVKVKVAIADLIDPDGHVRAPWRAED